MEGGVEPGGRVPQPRVGVPGEGGEGRGELHGRQERVGGLFLVRHPAPALTAPWSDPLLLVRSAVSTWVPATHTEGP